MSHSSPVFTVSVSLRQRQRDVAELLLSEVAVVDVNVQ